LRDVSATRGWRVLGSWVGFLALTGLWLGHTLEDIRVSGGARLAQELTEPTFMLPLGVAVAILATIAGARLWRLWLRLSSRLDAARYRIRAIWRNHALAAPDDLGVGQVPSFTGGVVSLWAPLTLLQLGLYLAQENLEALFEGARLPGAGPVTGAHWPAVLINTAVALVLAAAATLLARCLRERQGQVTRLEALVRRCTKHIRRDASPPASRALAESSPLSLFGASLWCRPPPLFST
jgi:hypothetical protein